MTAPLWTWPELVAATGGQPDGAPSKDITSVSIDTRALGEGDVFVALKDQRDGHDFVSSAFEAGAAAAIVARHYQRQDRDGALLYVDDTLTALERAGSAARARLSPSAKVIAVTGSAGKTGTKDMLRACLARLGKVHASEKSYNNHWGVPLTLARMPADCAFAVFEIGMNHAGEIRPLTKLVKPHAAIVTTVEAVHLEHFGSVEDIADAKGEIFEGLSLGGAAIIKADNPHCERLTKKARACGARAITFGFTDAADVFGAHLMSGDDGSAMMARISGRQIPVAVAMPGRHIAENALAALAAIDAVGADAAEAIQALATLTPPAGRGARAVLSIGDGTALLIDESYNANPASMRAALETLGGVPRGKFPRRIAVLGDMLELGPNAAALHSGLKDAVDAAGTDVLFACGPHMKGLYDAVSRPIKGGYAMATADLEPLLLAEVRAGDVVMLKASNGTRLARLAAALKAKYATGAA